MVFLEHDYDSAPASRVNRWWAAWGAGGSVSLPLVMVSSGHAISNGQVDYASTYRAMVQGELARPPQAGLTAYWRRVGDVIRGYLRLTNLSGVTLYSAANAAKVHLLVWEDARVGVTGRYVRAAASADMLVPLASGATTTLTLEGKPPAAVNWDKLHTLTLVDYQPEGGTRPYDMLQAALALPAELTVSPAEVQLQLSRVEPAANETALGLAGPHVLTWSATSDAPWLTVSPATGAVPAQVTARALAASLGAGAHTGHITFIATSADGLSFTKTVIVTATSPDPQPRLRRRILRSTTPGQMF
ncbi:MAG: hypothetical protein V1750_01105 [Acidobacteriota bacterium]